MLAYLGRLNLCETGEQRWQMQDRRAQSDADVLKRKQKSCHCVFIATYQSDHDSMAHGPVFLTVSFRWQVPRYFSATPVVQSQSRQINGN
jgi:hypothetical protein